MAHIALETTIAAPAGAVFTVLNMPSRRPEWMTNLHEVRNVTKQENGERWDYTYTMLGRQFTGTIVTREREGSHYVKLEVSGGITGVQEWRLTPLPDDTTLVRFIFDYTVPLLLGGGLTDKLFIEGQNERQFRMSLENLKQLIEYEQGMLAKEHAT